MGLADLFKPTGDTASTGDTSSTGGDTSSVTGKDNGDAEQLTVMTRRNHLTGSLHKTSSLVFVFSAALYCSWSSAVASANARMVAVAWTLKMWTWRQVREESQWLSRR